MIGAKYQISSISQARPASTAMASQAARNSAAMALSVPSSGWRRSTVKNTRPGMVLREFGLEFSTPTVATACGGREVAMRRTSVTMPAAPARASLRRSMGVVPAWDSAPVTVISNQRWPCAPVTTPIGLPSASRIGPCSMCASK